MRFSIIFSCPKNCSGVGDAVVRASEAMLGKPVETSYSPSAFDQGYLNHVGIATANFVAGEHQYAHTDYDMASVERTTDSARVHDAGLSSLDHHAHAASYGNLGWLEDAALEADKCHSRITLPAGIREIWR